MNDIKLIGFLSGILLAFAASAFAAGIPDPASLETPPLPAEGRTDSDVVASPSSVVKGKEMKLDLDTAIDIAIKRNPTVRNFAEKVHEADAIHGIAMATLFPTVNATGTATYEQDPLDIGSPLFGGQPYNNYQVGANFTQSLYAGGNTLASIKDSNYEKQLRTFDLIGSQRDMGVSVLQAFYSVLLAQRMLASLERNMAIQNDLLKLTLHRQVIGRNQLLDVLNIETQKALLIPQIDAAKNQIRTQAATLAQLIGEKDVTEFHLPDVLVPLDANLLFDKKKSPREPIPELEHAQMIRDQFEQKRTEGYAPNMPSLNLVGTLTQQAYVKTDLFSENSTGWTLGLQLAIPIFSGLSGHYEAQQLASQAGQLEIQQAGTITTQAVNEVTTRENLVLAQQNMAAYREAYALGAKSLKEAKRTYQLATIDYTQFLTTQQTYFQAEVSYEQSKYNTINAAALYCVAAGIPLKHLLDLLGVKKS